MTTTTRPADIALLLETEAVASGTANQRERYLAGVLPEDELLFLARNELFLPFSDPTATLKRWDNAKSLRPADARHGPKCHVATAGGESLIRHIHFDTCAVAELSHGEYEMLKQIHAVARTASLHRWCARSGVLFTVMPRSHWATCDVCKEETVKSSALVSVLWAGRELAREYALAV